MEKMKLFFFTSPSDYRQSRWPCFGALGSNLTISGHISRVTCHRLTVIHTSSMHIQNQTHVNRKMFGLKKLKHDRHKNWQWFLLKHMLDKVTDTVKFVTVKSQNSRNDQFVLDNVCNQTLISRLVLFMSNTTD